MYTHRVFVAGGSLSSAGRTGVEPLALGHALA